MQATCELPTFRHEVQQTDLSGLFRQALPLSFPCFIFRESYPSGGSSSKRNYRSPLGLDKSILRNSEDLRFCSFIDTVVFFNLLFQSATRSAHSP